MNAKRPDAAKLIAPSNTVVQLVTALPVLEESEDEALWAASEVLGKVRDGGARVIAMLNSDDEDIGFHERPEAARDEAKRRDEQRDALRLEPAEWDAYARIGRILRQNPIRVCAEQGARVALARGDAPRCDRRLWRPEAPPLVVPFNGHVDSVNAPGIPGNADSHASSRPFSRPSTVGTSLQFTSERWVCDQLGGSR